jgi:hypothetical protein
MYQNDRVLRVMVVTDSVGSFVEWMSAERDVSTPMIFAIGHSTRQLDVFIRLQLVNDSPRVATGNCPSRLAASSTWPLNHACGYSNVVACHAREITCILRPRCPFFQALRCPSGVTPTTNLSPPIEPSDHSRTAN